jgi:hypothetical protein
VNLVGQSDTTTAATHYYVETGSDGFVRPKTLANVKAEIGASIGLTGTPTAAAGTNTTQIATTAFVQSTVLVQSKKGYGTGASGEEAFFLNETTINTAYTVPANYNAGSFGPITTADGVTVTVSDGSAWSIV